MNEKVIITLFKHKHWGYVLQPVLVTYSSSGLLNVIHIVSQYTSCFATLTDLQQQIVRYSELYSDEVLMKSFSKEKTLIDFYKTVKPNVIEHYIRPIIEQYHIKIVELLSDSGMELYHRSDVKDRTLYTSDKFNYTASSVHVVFHFIRDQASGLRYYIRLKQDGEMIGLKDKTMIVLCNDPAIVCLNNRLFVFKDIDSKKLFPFLSKDFIMVPPASEQAYIKKFVVNCVRDYEVEAEGLSVNKIIPVKRACLSLEKDLMNKPQLLLEFEYNGKRYFPTEKPQKIVIPYIHDSQVMIEWFELDRDWERSMIALLEKNGLKQSVGAYFELSEELTNSGVDIAMIHWLQTHAELLNAFHFDQQIPDKQYFLGDVILKTVVDEQQDWFDVKCIVAFGNYRIPFTKFKNNILNYQREYILPDGTVAILPDEWFSRYQELMYFGKRNGDCIRLRKYYFPIVENITGKSTDMDQPAEQTGYNDLPEGICVSLRPYQLRGFNWLANLYNKGYGGCLADDMGLGKTLQMICLLQYVAHLRKDTAGLFHENINLSRQPKTGLFDDFSSSDGTIVSKLAPSLVVVPTSLLHNWQNEFKHFAPNLKIFPYVGAKRQKIQNLARYLNLFDVVLTTYGVLRNDIDLLSDCHFDCLVLDESQQVKNPTSMSFKAVKLLPARHRFILTGTPIENSLSDLWAQFEIVNPGMLGLFSSFKKIFIQPISQHDEVKERALLRLIQPFILRRTKLEVAPELPPMQEEVIYCDMSEPQQALYEKEKSRLRNNLLDNNSFTENNNALFITLQGLTRLRLIANHPYLYDDAFSENSGKFERVTTYLEMLRAEHHKVLVFSSFVKHLRLFADYFEIRKWKYAWLTGETQMKDREKEINRFMKNDEVGCFFISLKAGGVGLNLTAADYVFILDPWWNPASEMQAVARSHRIGQGRNVMVYRFISTNTIEEKIRKLQESKSKLAETFIRSSSPLEGMTREEVETLLI